MQDAPARQTPLCHGHGQSSIQATSTGRPAIRGPAVPKGQIDQAPAATNGLGRPRTPQDAPGRPPTTQGGYRGGEGIRTRYGADLGPAFSAKEVIGIDFEEKNRMYGFGA